MKLRRFGLLAALMLFGALPVQALTIGTFNIEYFNVSGSKRYSDDQVAALSRTIGSSGAELLALQEIEGHTSMRYLTARHLTGWKFTGNDTKGAQDLYFLWNPEAIEMTSGPDVYFANASFRFRGKSYRLFDRPLLVAQFREKRSGWVFTAVNLHLKSQSTRGKSDRQEARQYNDAKRGAQIGQLNRLVHSLRGPVFVLGDYNSEAPEGLEFPLWQLPRGQYSYDAMKSNIDGIGFVNIEPGANWKLYEVETAIASRSTKKSQHPDHDMVLLNLSAPTGYK